MYMPHPETLGKHQHAVLACDVGGTDIKISLMDTLGRLIGLRRVPTARGGDHKAHTVAALIAQVLSELRQEHPAVVPASAGISVPGIVDEENGTCVYSRNLGWRDVPIRDILSERLGLPVALGHDVRSAGLAELTLGPHRGARNAVIMIIGTGIAGAIVADGRPVVSGGYAGEIGQGRVSSYTNTTATRLGQTPPNAPIPLLEDIASARGIARQYHERSGNPTTDSREVLRLMESGDAVARDVWNEAVDALAEAISQCASITAPEVVILGGGLSEAGEALIDPIRARLSALLAVQRNPRIASASLGGNAGLIGSALLGRSLSTVRAGGPE
ncbi:ROK family protein [Lysinibacter sp. HNR]|uniref:ROK family protein n=1 Tax=Lysinibacter sp. HNR TaxID=3031408 RepID=UPI002435A78B|nr:ROK family protein [Lysinibacter sp. HNR]WGD38031.1 ROK family protein [Lysinibacter sp. HNR]